MQDEYQGQGGSYLVDPKTGKRKLIQRTMPAQPTTPDLEVVTDDAENEPTPTAG
jgi:hypothetical protein